MPVIEKDSEGKVVKSSVYGCKTCGYPEKKGDDDSQKVHTSDESASVTDKVSDAPKKKSYKQPPKKEVK